MGTLSIRRIGWASYVITTEAGTRILVDPYLYGSAGADSGPSKSPGTGAEPADTDVSASTHAYYAGLPESPITVAELADVDVIAVTHAGFDHRAQAIDIALAGEATLVCGTALYGPALEAGIPAQRCAGIVSGVVFQHGDATLKALAARHTSNMMWRGQFVADEPMSFMLTTQAGSRIFCGGDFSISPDLRTWGELYAPHVAILGIGGMSLGPITTTELPPADAAIAAEWLGVSHVIPVHYAPGDPAPEELGRHINARGSGIEVVALEFGQTWTRPSLLAVPPHQA